MITPNSIILISHKNASVRLNNFNCSIEVAAFDNLVPGDLVNPCLTMLCFCSRSALWGVRMFVALFLVRQVYSRLPVSPRIMRGIFCLIFSMGQFVHWIFCSKAMVVPSNRSRISRAGTPPAFGYVFVFVVVKEYKYIRNDPIRYCAIPIGA